MWKRAERGRERRKDRGIEREGRVESAHFVADSLLLYPSKQSYLTEARQKMVNGVFWKQSLFPDILMGV